MQNKKPLFQKLSKERVKTTLQHYQSEDKSSHKKNGKLKNEIKKYSLPICTVMSYQDMISVQFKILFFYKDFREKQQECLNSSSKRIRYHLRARLHGTQNCRKEFSKRFEISNWFEFTSGLM